MAERRIEELELEELEQRIAPSITGYEGQPGNQGGHQGGQNPVSAGAQPQPNG
jgi:hypothetical protein